MFRFLSIAALLFFAATSARAQSGPEEWVWGTSTGAGGLKSFAAMQGTMAYTGETGTNTWYDMEASSMVDSRGTGLSPPVFSPTEPLPQRRLSPCRFTQLHLPSFGARVRPATQRSRCFLM